MDIFIRLNPAVEKRFAKIPALNETFERARAANLFFCTMNGSDAIWKSEANLRAGLNEFYSIEDAVTRDFRRSRFKGKPPKIRGSLNPLLHLMLVLRHLNVHVRPDRGRKEPITVESRIGEPHEFTFRGVVLELDAAQIAADRNVKGNYSPSDVARMVAWVMDRQSVFGAGEVLRVGVDTYCLEILAAAR